MNIQRIASRILLALLAGYRLAITPWLPPRCRFAPSCSAYAAEAIVAHGPWAGAWLALKRLGRCHPWHPGGYDPVPSVLGEAGTHGTEGCSHARHAPR